jgi:hypothetical protein
VSELLRAVAGSPILLAVLAAGWFGVLAVERLCGANGPASRILAAWRNRELNQLRREAMIRAERRRLDAAERSERETALEHEAARLRRERDDARRQRDALLRQIDSHRRPSIPAARGDPDTAPLMGQRRNFRRAPSPAR